MPYKHIDLEHRGPVAWLYLNRPEAMNAVSIPLLIELRGALSELEADDGTRVVVLSGKGRAFCAGADLKAPPEGEPDPDRPPREFIDVTVDSDEALSSFPKPTIAAVNGLACGGGLELAMMCDLIVAVRSAKLGDAHSNFGMIPGGGATLRLPRIVGLMRARYMMFTGDLYSAEEMAGVGLVSRVVEDGTLESEVQALGEKLAGKSPLGLKRMKQLINDGYDQPSNLALKAEKHAIKEHLRSHDASEGFAAFSERRKPNFRGF
ncbi:MAG: enoyl-CoA hydratase/isomerase family protein [Deltaproteobacteria bacterium]|nr:enoyl-CoA hydratase/isomerase family protein [Deltaproteobacteria bacterium]